MKRRFFAIAGVALAIASVGLAIAVSIQEFPGGLLIPAALICAFAGAATGIFRRGALRVAGFAIAAASVIAMIVIIVVEGRLIETGLVLFLGAAAVGAAREAFLIRVHLPAQPAPRHPVLIFNPLSGDGKAKAASLAEEAEARGIEAVELRRGDDLRKLVRDAVERGADALAMAGGDGSQAIVAEIAAEIGLPYACIPAGTRNHFALDLGVDRNDLVGSLDAFVDGGEVLVDLGEVNGRVFVNNVSLGVYADAVQRAGYREAKIRTLLDVIPEAAEGTLRSSLRWTGPDGGERESASAVLVSNNPYRLGGPVGSGTRPRLDDGVLGILAIGPLADEQGRPISRPRWEAWSTAELDIAADEAVAAGIDGEATMLEPPLLFRTRPGALRVRICRRHPGVSPSASLPHSIREGLRGLWSIARGRESDTGLRI